MIKLTLLSLTFLISLFAISQNDEWVFDRKSIENGLSNTFVSSIIKDYNGFVWIATSNGLNRYNAYSFEIFKNAPENNYSLSGNEVNCLFEDSKNRLWIGTDKGLSLYNNATGEFLNWKDYKRKDSVEVNLNVREIVEDNKGQLWLGTYNGIVKFNPEQEVFSHIIIESTNPRKLFKDFLVRSLLIDSEQNLWIGTNGIGIIRYSIPKKEVKNWRNSSESAVRLNYCFSLYQDIWGDIWAGTFVGGLTKYNVATDSFYNIHNPYHLNSRTKIGVISISNDTNGNLLIGSNGGGLFLFNPKTELFTKNFIFDPIDQHSIGDDFIVEIFVDETNIIWLGTENGGISLYDPNRCKFNLYKKLVNGKNALPGNLINTIYETEKGLLWIGTESNGYASLDRSTNTYKKHILKNVKTINGNTYVKKIISDGEDGLWIAGHMGGLAHADSNGVVFKQYAPNLQPENPNHINDMEVRTLALDQDNGLWIGSYRGLSEKVNNDFWNYCLMDGNGNQLCQEAINTILDFNETYLIIGYGGYGLRFYNKKTKEFESVFTTSNSSISANTVNSLCLDIEGRLWIGTNYGLNKFSFKDSTFTHYTTKDGLSDNKIFGILNDDRNNLWISTANGLCCFNTDKNTYQKYFESDGLQSNVFREGAYYKSRSGEMFFGGVSGFNSFYPDRITPNPNPPPVVFTNFQLFNKPVATGPKSPLKEQIGVTKRIELDYNQSTISFEFVALNFTSVERNQYAYKLIGMDNDWQYIGTRRYITFTNLSSGSYSLQVIASNNDGVWNTEGAVIEIIIHPPFWNTWWFRIIMLVSGVLLLYLLYKWRIQSIEKQNKLLEEEVKERTKEVVEQKTEITNQKELVEEKNRDITSSIRYAKRIQESFLPNLREYQSYFENIFVFFSPKDIVSGDFYWIEQVKNSDTLFVAVADCTGHGVPGAMVSILGNSGLNRSVNELRISTPNAILDNLNDFVQQSFNGKDNKIQDGMDIALCAIDMKTKILQFAGANNPVWIARNGNIKIIKGTKQPIGNYYSVKPFECVEYQLQSGDWVFLFSDGFADQFGGPNGKKYKYAKFKKHLLNFEETAHGSFENYLKKEFNAWKNKTEQVDDVCVLGLKIS
ncbi:MAG: SpoIIE family protein phosphatase [Crocinitomix sp.]|nr:SpoIIE family protein phosphatase [Crocinitomix sp.]